jgi:hypothetical protein
VPKLWPYVLVAQLPYIKTNLTNMMRPWRSLKRINPLKKDSKEYKEKMKALYRKAAGNSLSLLDQEEESAVRVFKKPTKPTDTEKQSK